MFTINIKWMYDIIDIMVNSRSKDICAAGRDQLEQSAELSWWEDGDWMLDQLATLSGHVKKSGHLPSSDREERWLGCVY